MDMHLKSCKIIYSQACVVGTITSLRFYISRC